MLKRVTLILLLQCWSLTVMAQNPAQLVIAHRGASGYLPEHTLEAKVLAFAQGADFIEQDVVMTQDDELVVFHDLTLERTTDVATRFPGRARPDGSYYVIDFTLAELRQLQVSEGFTVVDGSPVANFPGRFPVQTARFGIHTFQEELELIQGLNRTTGKSVGIYPELKSPWFHHQHNKDIASAVLQVLIEYGYDKRDAPAFVQSFDYPELVRVHDELLPALGIELPLVQLIADNSWLETYAKDSDGNWQPYDYGWMHTAEGLQKLAKTVVGVGPGIDMLVQADSKPQALKPTSFVTDAHAAGLKVHAYTFRSDAGQVPAYAGDFDELLEIFSSSVGIDGFFTDFPDKVVRFLEAHN
ncbi:MAG: glycerophosphodiester phosphodiesterase [Pseudomonadota bacterium]